MTRGVQAPVETAPGGHQPVMLQEVLSALVPRDGGTYVDGTFGAGGYSRAMLEAAHCSVWALDRDPGSVAQGAALARDYPGRLHVMHGRFGDMTELLADASGHGVDGVALDLGLSSLQLDAPDRGFAFRFDGPLDMRMDPTSGRSAAEVVNTLSEQELADILYHYGEERRSRAIARAIVQARTVQPIETSGTLAEIVRSALRGSRGKIDPATRTFQALRIYVNDEMGELDRGLCGAEQLLTAGGCLAVVSFHSLEDRKVKSFLNDRSGAAPAVSRHSPQPARLGAEQATFDLLFRSARKPSAEEIKANPRARSARLRAARRTAAPARLAPLSRGAS